MIRLCLFYRKSFRRVLQAFAGQPEDVRLSWREQEFYIWSDVMHVHFQESFFDYYTCDTPTSITITPRSCRRLVRNWSRNQVLTLELLPTEECVHFVLQPRNGGPVHQGVLRDVGSNP